MQFGDRLKQQRKIKELTQDDVARKLNVSRQTISSWENENSYPDIKSLIQLSNLYNISLDTMLKEDKGMKEFIEKSDLRKKMVGLNCSLYSSYALAIAFYILIINHSQHVSPAVAILGIAIYAMSLCIINSFKKLMVNLGFNPDLNPIHHILPNKYIRLIFMAVVIIAVSLFITPGLYIIPRTFAPFFICIMIYEVLILVYYLRNR